jgi:hypothetical protein
MLGGPGTRTGGAAKLDKPRSPRAIVHFMRRISVILICACVVGAVLLANTQHSTAKHASGPPTAVGSQLASTEPLASTDNTCATAGKCSSGCWLPIADSPARRSGPDSECAASKQQPCMLLIAANSGRPPSADGFCQSQGIRVLRNLKPARPKAPPKSHR